MVYSKTPLFVVLLLSVFFLTSCGGGGGGTASNDTVINGIPVPPEPDPTANNATLAGVDSNSNGVRDDAERMFAGLSLSGTYNNYTLKIAQILQKKATTDITTQQEYDYDMNTIVCLNNKRPQDEQEILPLDIITGETLNTRERSAQYYKNVNKWNATHYYGEVSCQ